VRYAASSANRIGAQPARAAASGPERTGPCCGQHQTPSLGAARPPATGAVVHSSRRAQVWRPTFAGRPGHFGVAASQSARVKTEPRFAHPGPCPRIVVRVRAVAQLQPRW
jgi:hypothetical protein